MQKPSLESTHMLGKKGFKFLLLCAALLLALASLPKLFSTSWGKKRIQTYLKKPGLDVSFASIHLSWFGRCQLKHLHVHTKEADFQAEKITTFSLFSWLFYSFDSEHLWDSLPEYLSVEKGKITLRNSEIALTDLEIEGRNQTLEVSGKTFYQQQQGSLSLHLLKEGLNSKAHVLFSELPLEGVDALFSLFSFPFSFSVALGPTADLKFDMNCCGPDASFSLLFNSIAAKIEMEGINEEDYFKLSRPGTWSWTISSALLPSLDQPLFCEGIISEFKLPLTSSFKVKDIAVESTFSLSPFSFPSLEISTNTGHLSKKTLDPWKLTLPLQGLAKDSSGSGLLEIEGLDQFSASLSLELEGKWHTEIGPHLLVEAQIDPSSGNGQCHAKSALFYADMPFKYQERTLFFSKDSFCHYTLAPSLWPLLKENVSIDLHLTQAEFPLFTRKEKMEGVLSFSEMTFNTFSTDSFPLKFEIDLSRKEAGAHFKTNLRAQDKKKGHLEGRILLSHFSWEMPRKSPFSCSLEASQIHTSLFESFFPSSLEKAIGPIIDLHLDVKESSVLIAKGQSRELQFELPLKLKDKVLELASGYQKATLDWHLTKESYSLFLPRAYPEFSLIEPGKIHIELRDLALPYQNWQFNLSKASLSLKASLDHLLFLEHASSKKFGLRHFSLDLKKEKGAKPLDFHVVAELPPQGAFSIKGHFDQFSTAEGLLNLDHLDSTFQAHISKLPANLLNLFSSSDFPRIFFGPYLDVTCSGTLQNFTGPLNLELESHHVRAKINGQFQSGIFTLNEPLTSSFLFTPAFSQYLLKQANPLSLEAITAEKPFTFTIHQKGFSLPLNPFSISDMSIDSMVIDPGKVLCKNQKNTNLLLSLLKIKAKDQKEIPLWFAPFELSLHRGLLHVGRTEILFAHQYDLCTWGTIDFDQRKVSMVLGLTNSTLKHAFGVQDLPENYVLQIPIHGPFHHVEINTAKATGKIAALLTKNTASKKKSVVGEALKFLRGKLDDQSKVPSAKHPFPWER